jgi:hypothetical protein
VNAIKTCSPDNPLDAGQRHLGDAGYGRESGAISVGRALVWAKSDEDRSSRAGNSIFERRRKILISTGLQPGEAGRKTSGSRFNGFGVQENPLKRVLSRENWFHPAEAGC